MNLYAFSTPIGTRVTGDGGHNIIFQEPFVRGSPADLISPEDRDLDPKFLVFGDTDSTKKLKKTYFNTQTHKTTTVRAY